MKYIYQYKSADNIQHSGSIHASSRERAFDKIVARGQKPFRLELAPGIGNKILIHLMKWGAAESALLALVVVVLVLIGLLPVKKQPPAETREIAESERVDFASAPRAQIPDLPPDFRSRLKDIFRFSSERFLALHAQPGVMFETGDENLSDLTEAIENEIHISAQDEPWTIDLKRIVSGMKEEASILIKSGKSVDDVEIWLTGRQSMESAYREQLLDSNLPESQKKKTLKALGL